MTVVIHAVSAVPGVTDARERGLTPIIDRILHPSRSRIGWPAATERHDA